MTAWLVYTNIGLVPSQSWAFCQYMDKSSYRNSTLLYSRYVIWHQTIVLTGVFLYCWFALVTFASFCLVMFCFVLHFRLTVSCAYGYCSWYVLDAGPISLKATTVSLLYATLMRIIPHAVCQKLPYLWIQHRVVLWNIEGTKLFGTSVGCCYPSGCDRV